MRADLSLGKKKQESGTIAVGSVVQAWCSPFHFAKDVNQLQDEQQNRSVPKQRCYNGS